MYKIEAKILVKSSVLDGSRQWAVALVVQFLFRNQTSVFTIKNRGTERGRDSCRLQAVPEQQSRTIIPVEGLISSL
ncbi:hypothetical protein H5410_005145 [Solanum commersonii]|uniref:Uncharacterized protein n=1 Tax=Solanum commersonii TaxID=4109 RepID=A0A9J6A7A3_SOLCO|nr:hypothetical protein H5410_005145 [Solanum commersonii]